MRTLDVTSLDRGDQLRLGSGTISISRRLNCGKTIGGPFYILIFTDDDRCLHITDEGEVFDVNAWQVVEDRAISL